MDDSSVFSIQWSDIPDKFAAGLTPATVLESYLKDVRRMTAGLITPLQTKEGLGFLLLSRLPLLTFLTPEFSISEEGDSVTMRICGGILVQRDQCHRGEMLLATRRLPEGFTRVTIRLSDYCPLLLGSQRPSLLRRWLYRLTQAYIHKTVTVRFLARLYRKLGGRVTSVRTVHVDVREGRKT